MHVLLCRGLMREAPENHRSEHRTQPVHGDRSYAFHLAIIWKRGMDGNPEPSSDAALTSTAARPAVSMSGHQQSQLGMTLDEWKLFGPGIETPHVSGALDDKIGAQGRVDDMVVDDQVVLVFDVWPVHVRCPIHEEKCNSEGASHPDHQPTA